MRLLASRLAAAYRRLFEEPLPFQAAWEEAVAREVHEQEERAAATAKMHAAIDAPSERTVKLPREAFARVTYVGRREVSLPAASAESAAAQRPRSGAAAFR